MTNEKEIIKEYDETIIDSEIEDVMKKSYIDYSMSVIVGRALPNIRDGLKPVHRRILYAMNEMGMVYNKSSKKSARIVGEVLGKYHPHGDTAVYDTLVRMVQDFSLRYPLIYGQGNFGSLDGDSAAAMRYTEAKLSKIANEMLEDIKKETVTMVPNFDGSLLEPFILPAKLPNLLINGSAGIAVGMATNIPPHNLTEVCQAILYMLKNPDCEIFDLMNIIKGPDFPTAGIIKGKKGIIEAYKTGRGKIKVEARTKIEEKGNKKAIIITEVPYMVNKANLVEEIANLVKDGKIESISDIRDESDREGVRVVIELKRDATPEVIINQLMKHSRMRVTFGANILAIVNGIPKILNLKDILANYIEHRVEIITKRTEFDLRKAEEREHILIGLIIALEDIDNIVKKIKDSANAEDAKNVLIQDYNLSDIQAKSILDMKLQKLASMEQEKIRTESSELKKKVIGYKEILNDEHKIRNIIKDEVNELKEKYGDERRTEIVDEEFEDIEDIELIQEEDVVITISNQSYVKRVPLETYKAQKRGGKGIIAAKSKEEDWIEQLFITNTHDYLLFFTDKGKVYWLRGYQIPCSGRQSKGVPIINLLNLGKNEKLTTAIAIEKNKIRGNEECYLTMFTKKGIIKKTPIQNYSNPRKGGIKAINLNDDDKLVSVLVIKDERILIASKNGNAVKFDSTTIRSIGRTARGVRGIKLKNNDEVVNATKLNGKTSILTITEYGYGKRTDADKYRETKRGGSGVINIKTTERNGKVVACFSVTDEDQIMLISKNGITIRVPAKAISVIGRNTQGVRIMKLTGEDVVVDAKKIILED